MIIDLFPVVRNDRITLHGYIRNIELTSKYKNLLSHLSRVCFIPIGNVCF